MPFTRADLFALAEQYKGDRGALRRALIERLEALEREDIPSVHRGKSVEELAELLLQEIPEGIA